MDSPMTLTEQARLELSDELPHEPGPDALWQESVVLLFQDVDQDIGGYIRVSHHPNISKAGCTLGIVAPGPWYSRRTDTAVMNPGDRSRTGYAAEDFLTVTFDEDTSRWRAEDESCSIDLHVTNTQPLYDTWVLSGLTGAFRDSFAPRHTETPGTIRGSIRIEDTRWTINGFAYRDHSWGLRNHENPAAALANFFWLTGSFGPDFVFQVTEMVDQRGVRTPLGYIIVDGEPDIPHVLDASFELELDGLTMRGIRCRFTTEKFGEFDFRVRGYGNVLMAQGAQYLETAMPGEVTWNGRTAGACVCAMFNARAGSAIPAWLFGAPTRGGVFRPQAFADAGPQPDHNGARTANDA
jgi:hypothetical protein